jgi:hypothetical protein
MQSDGNLVLYNGSWALWASNTWGNPVIGATMQTDGNLVIYNTAGSPIWASNTSGHPLGGAYLAAQNDCNVVIYLSAGAPLWSTGTFDCTFAVTGTPFGGWWDRFGATHPSTHHRVE